MSFGAIIGLGIVIWLIIMTLLIVPASVYMSAIDRMTKAKWRNDRAILQIMLDNLRSFPEQWSVARDAVAFPAQGSKQIYLNYDKSKEMWTYSLSSFGGNTRPLDGHFGKEFGETINKVNNHREAQSLLRNFYPELDNGQLLLK